MLNKKSVQNRMKKLNMLHEENEILQGKWDILNPTCGALK